MEHPDKAKPATAETVNGLRRIEQQLGGQLLNPETNLTALRAQYLSEVFALPSDTASVLAELAFGEVRS